MVLEPANASSLQILDRDDLEILRRYSFEKYFHKNAGGVLYEVAALYLAEKECYPGIPAHLASLADVAAVLLRRVGVEKHLEDIGDTTTVDRERLIVVFAKAHVEEARLRGVFDKVGVYVTTGKLAN